MLLTLPAQTLAALVHHSSFFSAGGAGQMGADMLTSWSRPLQQETLGDAVKFFSIPRLNFVLRFFLGNF